MAGDTSTSWLNGDEMAAWRSLVTLVQRAFPEIERDLRLNDGLQPAQYQIFVVLSEAPGRRLRLTDLACAADISPSRLTHRLRTLVDRGEVEIHPDPGDKRAKLAELTKKGQRRLEAAAPGHAATVRRVIFDHLTDQQSRAIAEALAPVIDSLCAHPEYLNPQDTVSEPT
ncbi:MAG: MarR family transcriptional regulator [Actinomycetota bacterium]